jgi:hypothetical protein
VAPEHDNGTCPVCLKVHPGRICLRPLTQDREEYLRKIEESQVAYWREDKAHYRREINAGGDDRKSK